MRNKIITSFFCLLLAVSALIGLLMPDRYYSEREKRTLTQKPKFTVANFISGEFSDELEKYLTDQVPLRDGWVTMKTYMELAIGKRESVGVYICKDKYLMDKFTSYSKKQLVANAAALVDLQEKLAAEGISMNTILVPMAAQVLTDKLPAYAPVADYAAILQVLTDAGVDTTDVLSALVAHSSENIYYRTDHHWTSLGAYYAYCAWRGIEPNVDEWTQEVLCDDFYGTTWNKVPLPTVPAEEITAWYKHINRSVSYNNGQYETDSLYERKYLSGSDQYAVFLNLFPISRGGLCRGPCPRPALFQGRCDGIRQRERYHRYAGAVRYAELCEGYKAALLTETARSLRGAGQKADGQRAVGFCPFCRLCAGEAGDLLRKTERRKNFAKRGLTMEVRVL